MRNYPTPAPRKNPPETGLPFLVVFAALAVATCVLLAAFYPWSSPDADGAPTATPWGEIDADDGDPYVVTPEPARGLRLDINPPEPLTDEQRYYLHMVQALPRLPIAFGLDKPPVGFTDDEAHVFTALIISESMLRPFDEYGHHVTSSIGCVGLAQLCFSLDTPETRESIPANVYAGARHFKDLLNQHGGDLEAAVSAYKGQTTPDTQWQTDSVFKYLRLVAR